MIERPRAWRGVRWVLGHFGEVLGCKEKEALAVTRLTVGVSNDLQMARNLTGGLPVLYQGRLANLGPFRESLTPAHETRSERGRWARANGPDSEWTTERTGRTGTDASFEKHADEMQMMTWQNATHKQMTWQRRRITRGHLVHRIRGVTTLLH